MKIVTLILSLILLSPITQAAGPNVIRVTITQEDGSGLAGEPVVFTHESGQVMGECITGDNGMCEIDVGDILGADGFIRGWLDVGDRGVIGRRSVIWRGGLVEIEMRIKNGQLDIPIHPPHEHPTFAPTHDTAATPTTAPDDMPTDTPIPTPTTPPVTLTVTPETTPTGSAGATATPTPAAGENRGGYGWTIALIVVVVLLLICFLVVAYSLTREGPKDGES